MHCWRCTDRDEYNEFGLCRQCRDELEEERTLPPGPTLHPKGTLPEEIGPYRQPSPSDYKTTPY